MTFFWNALINFLLLLTGAGSLMLLALLGAGFGMKLTDRWVGDEGIGFYPGAILGVIVWASVFFALAQPR